MGSPEWLPPVSVFQRNSLASVSLGGFSKSRNGLTQFPFELLPVLGLIVYEICAHSLRVGSLFSIDLPSDSPPHSVTGLQEAYLLIESHNPQAGELSVRFRILAPWGEVCNCDYPAVCGLPTQDKDLTIPCLLPKSLSLFFISVVVKNIVC